MKHVLIVYIFLSVLFSCNQQDQETPEPTDFGYLSMNIVLSIEEVPASGRIEAVSTDDWSVTIFNALDDSEVINFTPFIDAPAEVQLPTGEYYVEANSNNFAEAAFENPYYFGRSDNFTIDKEELKTIDVNAELANSKVKINYLPSVTNTFDRYSGTVMVVGSGESLLYNETETREGYFVSAPLAVEVNLSYDKLGGGTIDRTFTTEIDAQPKTLYNINVDATLEDGEIMLNINVDEDFETVEIQLGENSNPAAGGTLLVDGVEYALSTSYFGCSFDADLGYYDCQIIFSDGEPDLCSGNHLASIAGIGSSVELDQLTNETFTFSTNNGGGANVAQSVGEFVWSLIILDIQGYDSNCELLPGFTLYDTDINGTTTGNLSFESTGTDFTINFSYDFIGGPLVSGSYTGPLINLN